MRICRTSIVTILSISAFLGLFQRVVAQTKHDDCNEVYWAWRKVLSEQDDDIKFVLAKEFLKKFPNSGCGFGHITGAAKKYVLRRYWLQMYSKCQEANKVFSVNPGTENLNSLLEACEPWIDSAPTPDVYHTVRLALATGYGNFAGFYGDKVRGSRYVEKALQLLVSETPPGSWRPEDWQSFRHENMEMLLKYQQNFKMYQGLPTPSLPKITDQPIYKDPYIYLLRVESTIETHAQLNMDYSKLSATQQQGIEGSEILRKIQEVVEKLREDYARVMALTDKQTSQVVYDYARKQFVELCRYQERHCQALVQQYQKEFGIK